MEATFRKYIILMAIISACIAGCKKNSPEKNNVKAQPAGEPIITSLSLPAAMPNAVITIYGINFSTVKDSVVFNGTGATVDSISATKIKVTVPANAVTGKISVIAGGKTAIYPIDFKIISPKFVLVYGGMLVRPLINIAADAAGNIYGHHGQDTIYKLTPPGVLNMFAIVGNSNTTISGIVVDATGNVYATSDSDLKIYKITPSGTVSTFAGSGTQGHTDGKGVTAQFTNLMPDIVFGTANLSIDASGNLYVTDYDVVTNGIPVTMRLCKITPDGMVSTLTAGGIQLNPAGAINTAFTGQGINLTDANGNTFLLTRNTCYKCAYGIYYGYSGFGLPNFVDYTYGLYGYAFDPSGTMYVSEAVSPIYSGLYRVEYN